MIGCEGKASSKVIAFIVLKFIALKSLSLCFYDVILVEIGFIAVEV